MSDDRTTDPQHPEHIGSENANGGDQPSSPYAPQSDTPPAPPYEAAGTPASAAPSGAPADTATPYGTPTPEAPASHTPAPEAPAYGAPAPEAGAAYGAPAYGAPAYGQPTTSTYGQPAYGAPNAAYGYGGGYAAPARTNVLAIVSLVASLVGFVLILPVVGSIAGVIMGHISLKQIKERGERGRGMALAGVIIGYVTLLFVILFIIGISILIAGSAGSSGSRYGA
ncbi:putative membrane protein [Microbacterium testaceum]|uniref:DUF4190 domain-containing protein n=1 Tax=Microbacterium TaxID=33882 RepID=UPI00278821AC|nr:MULTISPECIES: DUF4190 domain-containing protein [Microbacterium]MDQ1113541.1 putative membrane protein [Microbacterium testaceum]MDR6099359.1 putative membrane protein [Microbacterium sp. SORGH_AS_0454]